MLHCVHYATTSGVYKSTDAGGSFAELTPNPGGAGSNNVEITSMDVAALGSHNTVTVGTRDTGSSEYGGVYVLEEGVPLSGRISTNIGSYDVYAVAFSSNFGIDGQLLAVATNETDTIISTKIGGGGWGDNVGDATVGGLAPVSANIAFPDDYDAGVINEHYILFVAIDTGSNNGDVYMISGVAPDGLIATDLNIGSGYGLSNVDVTGLAIAGNAAGASDVEVKPVFQWTAVAGADSYELLVSASNSFSALLIVKIGDYALSVTTCQSNVSLDHDTTYYWKVRAANSNSYSDWSAVGDFTTESLPPPEPSPLPLGQSSPLPSPDTPDWVKRLTHLGGILLLTIGAIIILLIILAVKVFKQ